MSQSREREVSCGAGADTSWPDEDAVAVALGADGPAAGGGPEVEAAHAPGTWTVVSKQYHSPAELAEPVGAVLDEPPQAAHDSAQGAMRKAARIDVRYHARPGASRRDGPPRGD